MKIIRLLLVCSLLIWMSGCTLLSKEKTALKPPLLKPVKQNFELAEVKRGTISREMKNSAVFISNSKQDLFFKSSGGRLKIINVKPGDMVKKGDVLAELEADDYEAQVFVQKRMLEKATIVYQQSQIYYPDDQDNLQLQKLDVEQARNELNRLNELLVKTKLIASIDGEVTYISTLTEGDYMTAYETVVSISDPNQVELLSEFDLSIDINDIIIGMDVEVVVDTANYHGHVIQAPSSAPKTADPNQKGDKQNILYISVDDLPVKNLLVTNADITITLEKKENTLIIPDKALSTYLGRNYVHVLDGVIRKEIDVEIGISANNEVEITKGLSEGQKVIVN
jgi:RND family efflux transporter MFP subunit